MPRRGIAGGPMMAAVCATGHLRTFVTPGVAESWAKFLLRRDSSVETDVYFMPKFGNRGHLSWSPVVSPANESDERLGRPMSIVRPWTKHEDILSDNDECGQLGRIAARLDVANFTCCDSPGFFNMMETDLCFRVANATGRQYDFFIRVRPDVGFFFPFPFGELDPTKFSFMKRHYGAGDDWIFVVGRGAVGTYWRHVMDFYNTCKGGYPDSLIFYTWPECKTDLCNASQGYMQPFPSYGLAAGVVRNEGYIGCMAEPPTLTGQPGANRRSDSCKDKHHNALR